MRLRATVTVEYDANPEDYGTTDPTEAAAIDQKNWMNPPEACRIWESFDDDEFQIVVEPA